MLIRSSDARMTSSIIVESSVTSSVDTPDPGRFQPQPNRPNGSWNLGVGPSEPISSPSFLRTDSDHAGVSLKSKCLTSPASQASIDKEMHGWPPSDTDSPHCESVNATPLLISDHSGNDVLSCRWTARERTFSASTRPRHALEGSQNALSHLTDLQTHCPQ